MSAWTYGDQGTAFPVESGQVWRMGRHVYACSDLMASDLVSEVAAEHPPTLVYCDPPWGQGLANGFRTKAGLGRADYDWREIYLRVAAFGHRYDVPVWVEGSSITTQFGMPVPGIIARRGDVSRYWDVHYMGGKPSGLYYAGAEEPLADPEGLGGFKATRHVLDAYPVGTVLDPCSGLGGVPAEAERAGWASVSNELSPWRVSKAMWRMREMTGIEPERSA